MKIRKVVAGLAAVVCCAAVVTALAGAGPEAVNPSINKGDRLEAVASAIKAEIPECAPAPWPYGCQWRAPSPRRLTRSQ